MSLRAAVHRAALHSRLGIEGMAAAMSTPDSKVNAAILRNQLTGNDRHHLGIDRAEMIIDLADSDELAHAAARQRGGVFLKLPEYGVHDRQELLAKFNEIYAELGVLSSDFNRFVQDDELDHKERAVLTLRAQGVHTKVEEMLALAFAIYGRQDGV